MYPATRPTTAPLAAQVNEYNLRLDDDEKPKDYQQDAKYYYGGKFQGNVTRRLSDS